MKTQPKVKHSHPGRPAKDEKTEPVSLRMRVEYIDQIKPLAKAYITKITAEFDLQAKKNFKNNFPN